MGHKRLSDEQIREWLSENIETEHALLSPVRLMLDLLRKIGLFVGILLIVLWNTLGWIIGGGGLGYNSRVQENLQQSAAVACGPRTRTASKDRTRRFSFCCAARARSANLIFASADDESDDD